MQNSSARCGRGEQQLWSGGRTAPRLGLKPIPVPTPGRDVLTENVRKDVGLPGSMMFADDIVLCGDDETDMTKCLATLRRALEDIGMKSSRPKTQFIDFQFGEYNGQGRGPV